MGDYRNTVLYTDAMSGLRELIDAGARAQACITSPPYGGGLRSYLSLDHPLKNKEIGQEKSPEEYVAALVQVFDLVRDILTEDGVLWIVVGDKFYGSGGMGSQYDGVRRNGFQNGQYGYRNHSILKLKDLILLPYELAKALRDRGWYLRSEEIWAKGVSGQKTIEKRVFDACLSEGLQPTQAKRIATTVDPFVGSCRPDPVKDRVVRSHEHVWMLTKSRNYYFDLEAIRENTLGGKRTPRSVWTISAQAYKGEHTATFPPELIEHMILSSTSAHGHCPECGRGYKRITTKGAPLTDQQRACGADSQGGYHGTSTKVYKAARAQDASETKKRILKGMRERHTVGWEPTCDCNAGEPIPALVLDPFMGSGTTAFVAERLGRHWLGIELNENYRPLIEERTSQYGLFAQE